MVGAEVLLRARNQILSEAGPQEFIPVAERNGLIRLVDLQVVRLLRESIERNRSYIPRSGFKFSLNISAESLKCDGFGRLLVDELQRIEVSPEALLIEVTESAMMSINSVVKENISAARDAGYEFSIDDFGTGYSSLSRLQDLPLEEVKVDRSFVARLGKYKNPSDTVVVQFWLLPRS